MSKNFIITAAGGAAGNLVRNMVLTSEDTHWPLATDRFETVIKQYPDKLKQFIGWWDVERKLRFHPQYYKIDLLLSANYQQYLRGNINLDKPIVFTNHSIVWGDRNDIDLFNNNTILLYVRPRTEQGLEWQVRALHMKCLGHPESMIDFSFDGDNRDQLVKDYIAERGQSAYFAMNIKNMRDITGRQQRETNNIALEKNIPTLALEDLLLADTADIVNKLQSIFKITLDKTKIEKILTAWRNLHWPYADTYNWEYA